MNGTGTLDQRVEAYVESVGRALGELDPEDRTAILDDVREHAAAVLTEDPGVDLVDRLGAPQEFARELLEAAGLVLIPVSRVGLRVRLARLKDTRPGRELGRAGRDFAPAIAALRGVAAVWILSRFLGEQTPYFAILLVLGAVAGWLLSAQYEALVNSNGRTGRILSVVANVVTAIVAVVMVGAWATGLSPAQPAWVDFDPSAQPETGTWVGTIQAFGPDGASVPVALYDGLGNPILTDALTYLTCPGVDLTPVAIPYLNSAGQQMDNVYPVRGVCVDYENVVVAEALVVDGEPPVQVWSTAGMPEVGQKILIDESGAFTGMVLDPTVSPSPSPAESPSPTPSDDPTPDTPAPGETPAPGDAPAPSDAPAPTG